MVNFVNSNIGYKFPGGRGTPLYKPCGYVPPHWEGFLRRFALESDMVFEGTRRVKKYLSFHPN